MRQRPRIAIPVPHSTDHKYGALALPQYEHAVRIAGGDPVSLPLDQTSESILETVSECDAVLLPGSNADVLACSTWNITAICQPTTPCTE